MAELSLTTLRLYSKTSACVHACLCACAYTVCVFRWEMRVVMGGGGEAQFKCDLNKGVALSNDNSSGLFFCIVQMNIYLV